MFHREQHSLGITSEQFHPLETEKQIHPCDEYCEKVRDIDGFLFWEFDFPSFFLFSLMSSFEIMKNN